MSRSLAREHLDRLGIPATLGYYRPEDVQRVLQGRAVDPKVRDTIHDKLAWIVGAQLVGHIASQDPDLGSGAGWVVVRTIDYGELSASFLPFSDSSHVVLVSRMFQELLISMANIVEYYDVSLALARLSLRSTKRERLRFEAATRMAGMLRYLVLSQRLTGKTPSAVVTLDSRSAEVAGQLAAAALMFVVAHEIGHISMRHGVASAEPYRAGDSITTSEVQELLADNYAQDFLGDFMAGDPGMVLWSAFIALFARQMIETATYIRRSRTQTRAFVRWDVLERRAGEQNRSNDLLRLAIMGGVVAALTRDEPFLQDQWALMWEDDMLAIDPALTPETLANWDRLQTCPLDQLASEGEQTATRAGKMLFDDLRRGDMSNALKMLGLQPRVQAEMLDRSSPLSFFALKHAIEAAPTLLTRGDLFIFSVAGARLAAEHLKGDHVDDW
jgi:hypothetical protein